MNEIHSRNLLRCAVIVQFLELRLATRGIAIINWLYILHFIGIKWLPHLKYVKSTDWIIEHMMNRCETLFAMSTDSKRSLESTIHWYLVANTKKWGNGPHFQPHFSFDMWYSVVSIPLEMSIWRHHCSSSLFVSLSHHRKIRRNGLKPVLKTLCHQICQRIFHQICQRICQRICQKIGSKNRKNLLSLEHPPIWK